MRSLLWEGVMRFMRSILDHDESNTAPHVHRSPSPVPSSPAIKPVPPRGSISPAPTPSPTDAVVSDSLLHSGTNLNVDGLVCHAQTEATLRGASTLSSPVEQLEARQTRNPERLGKREKREAELEGSIAHLFRRFCYGQAVVIGELPILLPRAQIFMISPNENVPPYCTHVRCEALSGEWPSLMVLLGFEPRESTVWLMRLQEASDIVVRNLLKAAADMSAPCSVVLLMSWSSLAVNIADDAGFSMDVVQYGAPLYLLRRKEQRARWGETESLYPSPMYSPPPEPVVDGWIVRFGLELDSLYDQLKHMLVRGSAKVVGNCRALGEWEVRRGVQMEVLNRKLFAETFIERGSVEYKYVVEGDDGSVVWEASENRRLLSDWELCIHQEDRWQR